MPCKAGRNVICNEFFMLGNAKIICYFIFQSLFEYIFYFNAIGSTCILKSYSLRRVIIFWGLPEFFYHEGTKATKVFFYEKIEKEAVNFFSFSSAFNWLIDNFILLPFRNVFRLRCGLSAVGGKIDFDVDCKVLI